MQKTISFTWAAVWGFLFSIHPAFWVLFTMVVIDYLTAVLLKIRTGTFNIHEARNGAITKCMYLVFVFSFSTIQLLATASMGINLPVNAGSALAGFLAVTELTSITLNCYGLGVPIPGFLVDWLIRMRQSEASEQQIKLLRSKPAGYAAPLSEIAGPAGRDKSPR